MTSRIEPILGRYLHLDIFGRPHRIYFEEAGKGIPLVCLHTAGTDGRQWRHFLNDEDITRDFRVITFDLPWHGKSYPPEGFEKEEYKLTAPDFVEIIRSFCKALDLKDHVVMGCSIGGRIVLDLAAGYGDEFRALIGLQTSANHRPWYDSSWMYRPDVHGGEVAAGIVSGLNRTADTTNGTFSGLIQFDASINPGSSGGPLLDARGLVIGIVVSIATPDGQDAFAGIGFAVPIGAALGGGTNGTGKGPQI